MLENYFPVIISNMAKIRLIVVNREYIRWTIDHLESLKKQA